MSYFRERLIAERKPNKSVETLSKCLVDHIKAMADNNDLSSPSHYTLIEETVEQLDDGLEQHKTTVDEILQHVLILFQQAAKPIER